MFVFWPYGPGLTWPGYYFNAFCSIPPLPSPNTALCGPNFKGHTQNLTCDNSYMPSHFKGTVSCPSMWTLRAGQGKSTEKWVPRTVSKPTNFTFSRCPLVDPWSTNCHLGIVCCRPPLGVQHCYIFAYFEESGTEKWLIYCKIWLEMVLFLNELTQLR